ncbi:hypothetical protein H6P81_005674 [Aristolochia fimbriata]|uniref:Uncharacterized protein n=1 Tax=Aristolochia fimbriata TaxID=158543 RepID=A0AAV7EXA8_ARIFI|nr:hypothetical protein H6P81_005674 [Aristolochia fimbriata]
MDDGEPHPHERNCVTVVSLTSRLPPASLSPSPLRLARIPQKDTPSLSSVILCSFPFDNGIYPSPIALLVKSCCTTTSVARFRTVHEPVQLLRQRVQGESLWISGICLANLAATATATSTFDLLSFSFLLLFKINFSTLEWRQRNHVESDERFRTGCPETETDLPLIYDLWNEVPNFELKPVSDIHGKGGSFEEEKKATATASSKNEAAIYHDPHRVNFCRHSDPYAPTSLFKRQKTDEKLKGHTTTPVRLR